MEARRGRPQDRIGGRRYPGKVAVVYRHDPFLSDLSFSAAIAAECGRQAGRFDPFHDRLFGTADSLGSVPWTHFALEAGVRDTPAFAGYLAGEATEEAIARDVRAGRELGIEATPTLPVDGLMVKGSPGPVWLAAYVTRADGTRDR